MNDHKVDLRRYRPEFPITDEYVYLNHAAVSAPALRTTKAVESFLSQLSHEGIINYPQWIKRVEATRALFAEIINADPDEIAFMGNTSQGISTIASGLTWNSGDKVLIPRPEFPANVYPWMNLERDGVEVRFVDRQNGRISVRELEKAVVPGTRLISVSSADYMTGYRCDLEELGRFCRQKGLFFCVDAIQTLGVVPMDVQKANIHFLATGSHKWLLSTMGCGALYISKEVNDQLHPEQVGWHSVLDAENFLRFRLDLRPDARRFEPGTMNVAGIYALGAALDLLLEAGIENIFQKVKGLNDLFYEGLQERSLPVVTSMAEPERSGILSFSPSRDAKETHRFLMKKKVMVSERGGMIRLSPHFYNDSNDVSGFFKALDQFNT